MGVSYFLLLSCLGLALTAQAQDCAAPTGGPNMNLKDSDILLQTFPDGTKVTFACSVGYVSAGGSGSITCTAGNWSPVRLKCEKRNCGSGGEVENGNIDYPEGTEFGAKMVITCHTGHRLVGRSEIICGAQGWADRLPTCEVVNCDPPPPFVNGSFSPNSETYQYGEVIRYTCLTHYTLNGSKSISCSANGKFEPDPPTCIKVNCKDSDIPNADWVQGSRPPYGHLATVTFQCRPGYKMVGEATQICQINSQWSPGLPSCLEIVDTTKATTTTTTPTTTTTTAKPTGDPTVPDSGSNVGSTVGIIFGVLISVLIIGGCCYYFGVPGRIKKRGSRNGYSDKEAAKDGEGIALS